jgi:hypothetical protein
LLFGRLEDAKVVAVSILPSDEETASSGVIAGLDKFAVSGDSGMDFLCVSPNEVDWGITAKGSTSESTNVGDGISDAEA